VQFMFQHGSFQTNFFPNTHFLLNNMNPTFGIFFMDQLYDICFAEIFHISLLPTHHLFFLRVPEIKCSHTNLYLLRWPSYIIQTKIHCSNFIRIYICIIIFHVLLCLCNYNIIILITISSEKNALSYLVNCRSHIPEAFFWVLFHQFLT